MKKFLMLLAVLAIVPSIALSQLDYQVNIKDVQISRGYQDDDTLIVLSSGEVARVPDPATYGSYLVTWYNWSRYEDDPLDDPNHEIVLVTSISGDTLRVTRAQDSTSASYKNLRGRIYKFRFRPTANWYNMVRDSVRYAVASGGADSLAVRPVFNVLNYGAVGDSLTDDHLAFQAAIDAAGDAGGGGVFIPPGYAFLIDTSLVVDTSYITIFGLGPASRIIWGAGQWAPLVAPGGDTLNSMALFVLNPWDWQGGAYLENTRISHITIRDLYIDYQGWAYYDSSLVWPSAGYVGIRGHIEGSSVDHVTLKNLYLKSAAYYAVGLHNSRYVTVENVTVDTVFNLGSQYSNNGIMLGGFSGDREHPRSDNYLKISNSSVSHLRDIAFAVGQYNEGSVSIVNSHAYDAGQGIQVESGDDSTHSITVTGNVIDSSGAGIRVVGLAAQDTVYQYTETKNVAITGNVIDAKGRFNASGIELHGNGITATGNIISNVDWGIFCYNVSRDLGGMGRYIVANNSISLDTGAVGPGMTFVNTGPGTSYLSDILVSNNIIKGNASPNTYSSGIAVTGRVRNVVIQGNIIDSCGGSGLITSSGNGDPRQISIVDNRISNNGQAGSLVWNVASGIAIKDSSIYVNVLDNTAFDNQAVKTQQIGLTFGAAITDYWATDNDLRRNDSLSLYINPAVVDSGLAYLNRVDDGSQTGLLDQMLAGGDLTFPDTVNVRFDGYVGINYAPGGDHRLRVDGTARFNRVYADTSLALHDWQGGVFAGFMTSRELTASQNYFFPDKSGDVAIMNDTLTAQRLFVYGEALIDSAIYFWMLPTDAAVVSGRGVIYVKDADSLLYYRKPDGTVVGISPDTSASGITTLNGLTVASQSFAMGTSGSAPDWSSTGSTHTLNIPYASATDTGLITVGTQTIAGDKTFSGYTTAQDSMIIGVLTANAGVLRITDGGAAVGRLYVPTLSAERAYAFQDASGTIAFLADTAHEHYEFTDSIRIAGSQAVIRMYSDGGPAEGRIIMPTTATGEHIYTLRDGSGTFAFLSDTAHVPQAHDQNASTIQPGTFPTGYYNFLDSILVGNLTANAGIIRLTDGTAAVGRLRVPSLGSGEAWWDFPDSSGTIALLEYLPASGIPYSDTTTVLALQWELDNLHAAQQDSIAALRDSIDVHRAAIDAFSATQDSSFNVVFTDTLRDKDGDGVIVVDATDTLEVTYIKGPGSITVTTTDGFLVKDSSGALANATLTDAGLLDSLGAYRDSIDALRGDIGGAAGMPYSDTSNVIATHYHVDSLGWWAQDSLTAHMNLIIDLRDDSLLAIRNDMLWSQDTTAGLIATEYYVDLLSWWVQDSLTAHSDSIFALRQDIGGAAGIPYSDTTEVLAMQWELDNLHAAQQDSIGILRDSIDVHRTAIDAFSATQDSSFVVIEGDTIRPHQTTRTVFPDTVQFDIADGDAVVIVTTTDGYLVKDSSGAMANATLTDAGLLDSLSTMRDSIDALRGDIGGAAGIPYSDTTSVLAMQWELDNLHAAQDDSIGVLRDSIDTHRTEITALQDTSTAIRGDVPSIVGLATTSALNDSVSVLRDSVDAHRTDIDGANDNALAALDSIPAVRTEVVHWQDTTSVVGSQAFVSDLHLDQQDSISVLRDSVDALRGDIGGAAGMPYSDTSNVIATHYLVDSLGWWVQDSLDALTPFDTTGLGTADSSLHVLAPHLGQLVIATRPGADGIPYSDTTALIAMQWELDADKSALDDTASSIRTDLPDLSVLIPYSDTTTVVAMQWELDQIAGASGIPYSDTTSVVAMQWELDNLHAAQQDSIGILRDSVDALRGDIPSIAGLATTSALDDSVDVLRDSIDVHRTEITALQDTTTAIRGDVPSIVGLATTSALNDSVSVLRDSVDAHRTDIDGANDNALAALDSIPVVRTDMLWTQDTTSIVAMQWELDADKSALDDTASAIRTDLPDLTALLKYSDTTSVVAMQWEVDQKQEIIDNLADTSKYLEANDTTTVVATQTDLFEVPRVLQFAISDDSTAIVAKGPAISFRMPFKATITGVRASLKTASSSGLPTFDIEESGTSILSTLLTIDANETTSVTAATAAVISDAAIADDAEITVDIDVAGTGAVGAKIVIYYTVAL